MNDKLTLKSDKFRRARGGYSRWLLILCERCKTPLFIYQKDGPGILKRLYLDRIITSEAVQTKNLICKKCGTLIGISTIYKKERRPAYRLFVGAVEKKLIRNNKLNKVRF